MKFKQSSIRTVIFLTIYTLAYFLNNCYLTRNPAILSWSSWQRRSCGKSSSVNPNQNCQSVVQRSFAILNNKNDNVFVFYFFMNKKLFTKYSFSQILVSWSQIIGILTIKPSVSDKFRLFHKSSFRNLMYTIEVIFLIGQLLLHPKVFISWNQPRKQNKIESNSILPLKQIL